MARPRQITDEQIDAAARETFVAHGPSAPVSLVAEKLGVSHAALLQRAGSKEKLLLRALCPGVPSVMQRLAAAPPPDKRGAQLVDMLFELLEFHESMLPALVTLRASGLSPGLPKGAEAPTVALRRLLTEWLARAEVPRKRARVLAEALLGSIEARCFNAYLGGEAFVDGDRRAFVRDLVRGLLPELVETRGPRS